jgi:cob(I)alamin adenosyltransferase
MPDQVMTVNLTRIYTKLGDGGETHLGDMSRVSKMHPRVEAYGTVDELNATIGVALLQPGLPVPFAAMLRRVQNDLLDVGADLSVPPRADPSRAGGSAIGGSVIGGSAAGDADSATGDADSATGDADSATGDADSAAGDADSATGDAAIDDSAIYDTARTRLRVGPAYTDWLERACDEVNEKLQPLRSFVIPGGTAAAAHLHVCRTVCRRAERRALAVGEAGNPEVVRYLNRLSDLLFILSRATNTEGDAGPPEHLWEPGAHAGAHGPDSGHGSS